MKPKSGRFIGSDGTNHLPRRRKRFKTNGWMSVPANHACITRIAWTTGRHGHADTEPGAGSRQIYITEQHSGTKIGPVCGSIFRTQISPPKKNRARRRFEKQYTGKLIATKNGPPCGSNFRTPLSPPQAYMHALWGFRLLKPILGSVSGPIFQPLSVEH